MNDEIKFDLDKDIIMQIEMASYGEYNDTLAMMNEHLGETYGYSNLKDVEEAQLHYEKELAYKAIKELQQENERLNEELKYTIPDVQHNQIVTRLAKEKHDYKSRCEKASEILKKLDLDKYTYTKENRKYTINVLLNIVQNGGDDNGNN